MAKVPHIPSSELTSEEDYDRRRDLMAAPEPGSEPPDPPRRRFLRNAALATTGAVVFGGALWASTRRGGPPAPAVSSLPLLVPPSASATRVDPAFRATDAPTPIEDVTTYNNFYELGLGKDDPAKNGGSLRTRPWTVAVEGEVHEPKVFDVDDLVKLAPLEERIYRMRCVEAWSMVIPWLGLPLAALLERVRPTSRAKHVAFTTLLDPAQLPGQRDGVLDWPYVEGLRLDEAMHPLTLLAVGLYGRTLPNQNGAPLRLVVPWKYGFKGIKSIVRIRLVEEPPRTTWSAAAPTEYGYFANVNPAVDHPRWSQATERRIGELGRRPTLPFNGYAEQVASLYAGMDLARFF